MAIEKELLDQLLAGRDPSEVFGKDGLLDDLKKALSERILNAELDDHLDVERLEGGPANRRNGSSKKTVLTGTSKMTLTIPRDRAGTFDPKLIARYQRRFPDFDDKIISMYARGMTVREIQGHLEELYGIDVSPDLISAVTDTVLEAVGEWQNRPLELCYPLVFFDAIRVKIRDEGFVRNKAVYVALAVLADGSKEILGLWIEQTEGAKFWLRVMNELKNRSRRILAISSLRCRIIASEVVTTARTCARSASAEAARASDAASAARNLAISEAASSIAESYHAACRKPNKNSAMQSISLPSKAAASSVDCASRYLPGDIPTAPPIPAQRSHSG